MDCPRQMRAPRGGKMQIDKTNIAVRERGTLELFDLSLHVMRRYFGPLVVAVLIGVVPMALLNAWLMRGIYIEFVSPETPFRYFWDMTLLVFVEAPLAGIPVTVYLGQALFVDQPKIRPMLRDLWKMLGQLLLYQVLYRGVLAAWLLMLTVGNSATFQTGEVWLILLCLYLVIIRAIRPYLPEVILLERNPRKARSSDAMTTRRRMSTLHSQSGGDLIVRYLAAAVTGSVVFVSLAASLWFFRGIMTNAEGFSRSIFSVYIPIAMWTTVGYLTVFRFLGYLDLRIRREGWEVELRMRVEANKLARQIA